MITLCLPVIQSNRIHALHMFVCVHACVPLALTNFLCLLPPLFLFFIYVNTAKAINSVIRRPSHSGHVTDRQTDRIQTDRPTDTHTDLLVLFISFSEKKKKKENVASIRVFFSSGLLLKPLENPPTTTAAVRHASEPP